MKNLFIFLLFVAAALPQNNKQFNSYLEKYFVTKNIPSISACVSVQSKIIWNKALGYSDLEDSSKSTPNSLYRIASISKSITAVAVMQLVEKGLVSLDDKANKYLSDLPKRKFTFTIKQLLSHTSGLRGYRPGEFESKNLYKSTRDVYNYLKNDSLEYEPGTKYLYSSLAYNFLSMIIENVTGKNFYDYVKENILIPAGMNNTFPDIQKKIIPNRVKGYMENDKQETENAALADLSIKIPGGGFLSTAADLVNFGNALLDLKLLQQSTLNSMLSPTLLKNGEKIEYGLGFGLSKDSKGRFYFGHTGGGTGFVSHLIIYPKEKIVASHLINSTKKGLDDPALELILIYLDKKAI